MDVREGGAVKLALVEDAASYSDFIKLKMSSVGGHCVWRWHFLTLFLGDIFLFV